MALTSRHWLWLALLSGGLLLLVLQYRLWFDDSGIIATRELQQHIAELRQQNQLQQTHNDELLAEVRDLKSGTDLLEEYAREDLSLVREGETFILFVDPNEQ